MSDQNLNNGYSTESDKCPNCGAMKVFSALVCPACGMSYSEAADISRQTASKTVHFYKEETAPEEKKPVSMNDFDPNAAFAKFKQSLDEGTNSEQTDADKTDSVIVEEAGKTDEQPDQQAPKIDEIPLNSGLYGERKYRFGDDLSKPQIVMSEKRPEPEPDQTIVPTRYGLDNNTVKEKREQSLSDDARTAKMFSTTVNNHYEQYRSNQDSSYGQQTYATPYNRGSFDAVPEEKPNVWAKILPLAIVLAAVVVIGIFGLKFLNREKNDNGVAYTVGSFADNTYTNEWSELRFKYDDKMVNAPSYVYSTMKSMYSKLPGTDVSVDIHMYAMCNDTPAVVVMAFSDGSTFGLSEDDFINDKDMNSVLLQEKYAPKREPDIMIGSHSYKVISGDMEYETNKKGRMYLAVRQIGNRLNVIIFYEIPGKTDLNTTKKYFQAY